MSELHYEVLVHDGLRRHRKQTLPDGSPIISSPVSSTLIYGEHDAVLVDPPFTYEQALQPKRLVTIDGDHFDPYLARFADSSGAAITWFTEHLTKPETR